MNCRKIDYSNDEKLDIEYNEIKIKFIKKFIATCQNIHMK